MCTFFRFEVYGGCAQDLPRSGERFLPAQTEISHGGSRAAFLARKKTYTIPLGSQHPYPLSISTNLTCVDNEAKKLLLPLSGGVQPLRGRAHGGRERSVLRHHRQRTVARRRQVQQQQQQRWRRQAERLARRAARGEIYSMRRVRSRPVSVLLLRQIRSIARLYVCIPLADQLTKWADDFVLAAMGKQVGNFAT